jgi:hypothetical protein
MTEPKLDAKSENGQRVSNVMRQQAETIRLLVDMGWTKEEAVKSVTSGDLSMLVQSQ